MYLWYFVFQSCYCHLTLSHGLWWNGLAITFLGMCGRLGPDICFRAYKMLYLVISSKSVYRYWIDIYLPWVIHTSMPSAEPLVTKVWCIAQPMIKKARYSALPISRGDFTPHNSRRTHSSPVRARYGCFFVSSKCDRSFMLEVYAVCNTVLLYRDISRVYNMFLWLAVFWRYEWRFMGWARDNENWCMWWSNS